MIKILDPDLKKYPELIQPPGSANSPWGLVGDNIVVITATPDTEWVITPDIIDIALSYSLAKIEVILEINFKDRNKFNLNNLAQIINNIGCSISLLPPRSRQSIEKYNTEIIDWYQKWRTELMEFSGHIYPLTSYIEYLQILYLHDKFEKTIDINFSDSEHAYLNMLIANFNPSVAKSFKLAIDNYISQHDQYFYQDIDIVLLDELILNPMLVKNNIPTHEILSA